MMNKKGDGLEHFKTLIIVIVILIVLLVFLGLQFGKFAFWADLLPSFNQTVSDERTVILRYQIGEKNLQYYSGTTWTNFKETLVLGDKILYGEKISENFYEYYFKSSRPDNRISFSEENAELISNTIYPKESDSYLRNGNYFLPNLTVHIIFLVKSESNHDLIGWRVGEVFAIFRSTIKQNVQPYGEVVLEKKDTLQIDKILKFKEPDSEGRYFSAEDSGFKKVNTDQGVYRLIRDSMIEWRDSVLANQISINYEGQDGIEMTAEFDVEKIEGDLIVRLTNLYE